ncbi:MAG: hypothetical protein AB1831_13375 [Pseudomonadota bacterium]
MAIFKAVLYVLAVLFLVGGGLCAATAVFIPMQGMGQVAILALFVMLISFVVMKWVGRPKFAGGSAGEAVVLILLFLFLGMPVIQTLAYGIGNALGLEAIAPLLSIAALGAVVYFLVRRSRRLSAARRDADVQPPEAPPQA